METTVLAANESSAVLILILQRDYKTENKNKGRLPYDVLFSSLKNCKYLHYKNDFIFLNKPTSSAKNTILALTPVDTDD